MVMLTRRKLVSAGWSIFAGLILHPSKLQAQAEVVEIHMRSDSYDFRLIDSTLKKGIHAGLRSR
jgi:hypothetical protein